MDFSMGVGAAASSERSDTRSLEENYTWPVPISHDVFQSLKNNESLLCEVLLKKFGCVSTLFSPALEGNSKSLVEPVFRKRLVLGLELSVWKDDLTKHAVDAVVNAANEDLIHSGGLAGALERAGGPDIREESRRLVATYGKIPVGGIAVTGAGKLPCKMIIHAVGPQWQLLGPELSIQKLQTAIINILNRATCEHVPIKTIAIPALGSGIFQVPVGLCTKVILQTICYHLQRNQVGHLKEIHLVSNEERTVAAFLAASESILGRNELDLWKSPETMPLFNTEPQLVQGHVEHQEAFKAEMTKFNSHHRNDNNVSHWTREEQRTNGLEAESPTVNLMGTNKETMQEAAAWIKRLPTSQDHYRIENNHILYFGKEEHDDLSLIQKTTRVSITEHILTGKTYLEIKGDRSDLIEVVMKIECMLFDVQEKVARKNKKALCNFLGQWTDQQPKQQNETIENILYHRCLLALCPEVQRGKKMFKKCGLQVIKVEEIKNAELTAAYQKKKKMMEVKTKRSPASVRAFQQVPFQFLDAVCRVGFHRFYTASCNPHYGAGTYFTTNLKNIADNVKISNTNEFIYVFEAEVLKGSSCQGHRSNIVPPPLSPGALNCYDSVVDSESKPETIVIFNTMQAIPRYLWTCIQDHEQPQGYSLGPVSSSWWNWEKSSNGSSVD
ncbi:protein mono-ADP-ribosyltransferase PARP9 [Perognathus longimembris pacificus]|uniref:protein mono-ADP-ribosyltransferase PARP9 n=1 Tax=Perognathus longimembris pacificus TaxID=214514 RepID=UPI002018CB8F|nr:protein mono-ADP-ribosyltransferase PARP9 [Perognathus longimembris pacificus]